jgi:hypothetical protein
VKKTCSTSDIALVERAKMAFFQAFLLAWREK